MTLKRWLAVLLSITLLLPTLLSGVSVSAADDRIIATIPYTLNVNKTIGQDGFLDGTGLTFSPIDVSAYSPEQVALELDLFMSGDVTKFKAAEMQLELTSSGRPDSEEYSWNPGSFAWESGKWFRVTLPLSTAGKDPNFRMNNINFMRLYVVNLKDQGGKYILKLMNARLVDVTKGEATDPIGDGSFTPDAPEWKLANMTYPTDDTVVAGYNLADYFDNAPGKDATAAIQSLLDGLRSAGGGTLFIPAGEYEVKGTLLIPEGVTICGDWRAPTDEHPEVVGTILKAYSGKGNANATAFITMLPNSTVRNLSIWYPEQDAQNVVEYPMTIKMFKAGNWGADYTHIRNVTLVNSFQGIQQGPDGNGCPNVHNVYGTPLMKGLQLDGIYDVGRFDYIYFAPKYWINSGLPGAPTSAEAQDALKRYLMDEGIAFNIRQDDWSYFAFTEVTGYSIGYVFTASENRPKDSNGNLTGSDNYANGQCYGLTFTNCDTAIMVMGISTAGELFSNITIKDCRTGIGVRENTNPKVAAGNMVFSHSTIDADTAIIHEGDLRLEFLETTIERGEVVGYRGPLTMTSCTFENEAPHVVLEQGATGGIFLGNKFANPNAKFLDNKGLCPVKVDHTPIEIDTPDLLTAEQAADKAAKPARTALYVASQLDKTGQTDVTSALQTLLNQAGNEGGGIVFLPGGHYRLNGSITIPSGVELKGAVDIGRIPFNIGSILKVYGGKGQADGTPTIKLSANSGIRGIVFDYPEQQHLSGSGQQVQAYPYAMQGQGENIYIVNVSLRNAYNGLDLMTYRCDNHYVLYMAGFCLNSVIKVGGGATGGVISNLQFNSGALLSGAESKWGSWPNSPTGGAVDTVNNNLINKYVQERMIFMQIGDVKEQIIYNNFTYLGYRGVQFIAEDGKAANGWFVGNAVDFTTVGFEIQAIGDMDIINAQIVSYLTRAEVNGQSYHVYAPESFTGKLNIFNLACWARPTAFVRVDGGTVNLYNSLYDSSSTTNQFALMGENGRLNLLDGALYSRNITTLVAANGDNLSMRGFFLERELQGATATNYKDSLLRLTRWSAPNNAALDPLAEMVFTEAFTGYPTETSGGVQNVLSRNGAFNSTSDSNSNSNVTLANVDYEWDAARLFLNQAGTAAFIQNRNLRLTPGQNDSLYKLESRVRIDSLCDGEDSTFEITIFNMAGNNPTTSTTLVTFSQPGGVVVDGKKLADWTLETWYRVGVEIDLRDTANKTYTIYLYDDNYKLLAKSNPIAFDETFQGNNNGVGGLRFAAYELTETESQTVAYVQYAYVSKRDVSSFGTKGDVNGDGSITTTDARMTLQRAVDKVGDDALNMVAADVNNDGKVNATDARLILQFAVGKISEF